MSAGDPLTAVEEDRLREAARLGAQIVLDLIDAGADPLVVKNTPGWQLQEVGAQDRYGSLPARGSGRVIRDLAAALDEVVANGLDRGPKRLAEGGLVTVVAPLPLVARGPMIYTTDEAGQQYGSNHDLKLEVPVGARLELTRVFDRGHAECRPVNGLWSEWIRPSDHPRQGHPDELVADAGEYVLGWIQPQDEGRLFTREV